eukprot:SRR837773.516.p1 GENE.SRR837773.516~~SRR837773.516.p1  ORF type:complete len:248 (-),score=63.77 SRR837773.516:215-934(-)
MYVQILGTPDRPPAAAALEPDPAQRGAFGRTARREASVLQDIEDQANEVIRLIGLDEDDEAERLARGPLPSGPSGASGASGAEARRLPRRLRPPGPVPELLEYPAAAPEGERGRASASGAMMAPPGAKQELRWDVGSLDAAERAAVKRAGLGESSAPPISPFTDPSDGRSPFTDPSVSTPGARPGAAAGGPAGLADGGGRSGSDLDSQSSVSLGSSDGNSEDAAASEATTKRPRVGDAQ